LLLNETENEQKEDAPPTEQESTPEDKKEDVQETQEGTESKETEQSEEKTEDVAKDEPKEDDAQPELETETGPFCSLTTSCSFGTSSSVSAIVFVSCATNYQCPKYS
jgi:cytoskeletal protein RodZ